MSERASRPKYRPARRPERDRGLATRNLDVSGSLRKTGIGRILDQLGFAVEDHEISQA